MEPWYSHHLAQLRRHHANAPMSNVASHENHEKINSWVSISPLYRYGAPLSGKPVLQASLCGSGEKNYKAINGAIKRGGGGEGRKRLQTNPWILKTAHMHTEMSLNLQPSVAEMNFEQKQLLIVTHV